MSYPQMMKDIVSSKKQEQHAIQIKRSNPRRNKHLFEIEI